MNIILGIIIIVGIFIIVAALYTKLQLMNMGITFTTFVKFVKANDELIKLYKKSKRYERFSECEQITFLMESEKVFKIFENVPTILWEDIYPRYQEVLNTYQNIKMARWQMA